MQSGEQLLDVLIESLGRLEAKLHDETPAIRDIWDRTSKNVYRPIGEEEFSDYIKRHLTEDLRDRGIISNREVRIHRVERTDIHVEAVILGLDGQDYDSVRMIIEVKGSWHRDLGDAMVTQLWKRYLKDNSCQHGLYLVGWFNCDAWDRDDYRWDDAPKRTVEEARVQFETQADGLTNGGTTIRAVVMDAAYR